MIALFTDFGPGGPYVGQMHAVLARAAPGMKALDLMHDAPAFDPRAAGYLLAALLDPLPQGAVVVGVVDPGVGSARDAVVLRAGGRWFVGPDNGLFAPLMAQAAEREEVDTAQWRLDWRPPQPLSASFHGRDLFAPAAVLLARGHAPGTPDLPATPLPRLGVGAGWPADLPEIVYLDRYGNALTGLRAAGVAPGAGLAIGDLVAPRARTFADVPPGIAFAYENAHGLMEIAVNRGRAADLPGVRVGAPVLLVAGSR